MRTLPFGLCSWSEFGSRKIRSQDADPSPYPATGHVSVSLRHPGLVWHLPLFPCLQFRPWNGSQSYPAPAPLEKAIWMSRANLSKRKAKRWVILEVGIVVVTLIPAAPAGEGASWTPAVDFPTSLLRAFITSYPGLPHTKQEWEVGLVLTLKLRSHDFLKAPKPIASPAAFLEFQNSKPSKPASSSTSKFPLGRLVFPTSCTPTSWGAGPLLPWCQFWRLSCHFP